MLTRTKWMIAGIATLTLLGTAVVAAEATDPALDPEGGAAMDASFKSGRWSKDGASVTGRYVSFEYANGTITDYARLTPDGAQVIFSSIAVAKYDGSDAKARAKGPVLAFKDGNLTRGVVFDAKNAAFVLASPEGNVVTLVVADGIGVSYHAGEKGWSPEGVLLTKDNRTARLVVDPESNVTVDGQTITVTLVEKGHLRFHVDGYPGELLKERWTLHKIRQHASGEEGGHEGLGKRVREMAKAHGRR